MRPRRQLLAILGSVALTVSCGGGPAPTTGPSVSAPPLASPTASAGPTIPIDTIEDDGKTVSEIGRTAVSPIATSGGSMTATASNGVSYWLAIPESTVVTPADISMTPVREIKTLHPAGTSLGAVKLEPSGTVFPLPLDLAMAVPPSLPASSVILALISSDEGATWEVVPGRIDGTTVHFAIGHFSLIDVVALTLEEFELNGLDALDITSSLATTYANRIVALAGGASIADALPAIKVELLRWLSDIIRRTTDHAGPSATPIDDLGLLMDISDYLAWHRSVTEEIDFFLTSGTMPSVADDADIGPLLPQVEGALGRGILRAIGQLGKECEGANPLSLASATAKESFAWGGIALHLFTDFGFQGVFAETGLANEESLPTYVCPRLLANALAISPNPAQAGERQRLIGAIVIDYGGNRHSEPGEFLPELIINVIVKPLGTVDDRPIDYFTGPDGVVDIELPLAAQGSGVSLSALACLETSDAQLRQICVSFDRTTVTETSPPEADLSGAWQGGLTSPDFNQDIAIKVTLSAATTKASTYDGDLDFSLMRSGFTVGGIFFANATGVLSVEASDTGLRAVLSYQNGPTRAPCSGVYHGAGTYNPVDKFMSIDLTGSDCSGEHQLTLAMHNFGD
jgi:hypothetical protein